MWLAMLLLVSAGAPPSRSRADAAALPRTCEASAVATGVPAPPDPGADPTRLADWYVNGDRTIWAGPVPSGGWQSGGALYAGGRRIPGRKTYWVRPRGTRLAISGRRLDGFAPALGVHIPCCHTSGFEIVGLHFPAPGCWEVSARSGEHLLRFVTNVR